MTNWALMHVKNVLPTAQLSKQLLMPVNAFALLRAAARK
jgi:hypothetical protein